MMSIRIKILLLLLIPGYLYSQPYAPPAGQQGTTAIPAGSPFITRWADSCRVTRGPAIITNPDSLAVIHGEPADATGRAGDGRVVSLGDGGNATLYFNEPVTDGQGPDFAVFENAFTDSFLELAFVEVSSDGINFFRFDAVSLTPTDEQVGPYGSLDARNINNLAGKYRSGYGTPFDLEELGEPAGLDIAAIHWIRIVDVIGILDEKAGSKDAQGNMINDPWPTPFASGGFDLDAAGVISGYISSVEQQTGKFYRIINMNGVIMLQGQIDAGYNRIDARNLPPGIYIMSIKDQNPERIIKTTNSY
jgi:hypothetical protein